VISAAQFAQRYDPKDEANIVHARMMVGEASNMPYHMEPYQASDSSPDGISPG
jgi:hypothetical protein